jgi:hypothetical protein
MLRFLRLLGLLVVLCALAIPARAFVPIGPFNEPWQIPVLGYDIADDVGGPKNLNDEYRWGVPVIYYGFDQSFLNFFGAQGVQAIEAAMAVYNGLQPVSSYDVGLTTFPTRVRRVNFSAQAQSLLDLKSTTMENLAEQLGLAEPERYAWCLHMRHVGPGGCPNDVSYLVVQRNLAYAPSSLTQLQYSEFINGAFIGYQISETCVAPNPIAVAVPSFPDPYDPRQSPVASRLGEFGEFFSGLTRDDAAGLRYLYNSNNINREALSPGVEVVVTNYTGIALLGTSNLAQLSADSLTNAPAALQTLYPDLTITSYVPTFTNLITTNVVSYFTNSPWAPVGTAPWQVYATNYTTNVAYIYQYQFANVVTNIAYTNSPSTLIEERIVYPGVWAVPGDTNNLVITNFTFTQISVPTIGGEYYIVPTNLCGIQILSNVLTSVFATTNILVPFSTNAPVTNNTGTNGATVTYTNYSLSQVFYYTNHQIAYAPIDCGGGTNVVVNARGVEKISFVRRDYDSLLGQFFLPVTNLYTAISVTNNTNAVLSMRRVVDAPDILFDAEDMAAGPDWNPGDPLIVAVRRNMNFDETTVAAGQFGPGTITPPVTMTYNSSGVAYFNSSPGLGQAQGSRQFLWASFDGTTNQPILYPSGASITNLVNQIVMQITTTSLPAGTLNVTYPPTTLAAQGGTPPLVWSLAPNSPGMPPGLVLFSDGTIGGIPRMAGTFDFTVRLTDNGGRYVEQPLTLTVNP